MPKYSREFLVKVVDYAICFLAANIDESDEDNLIGDMTIPEEMTKEQYIVEACRQCQSEIIFY
jgi:hypothetical protein